MDGTTEGLRHHYFVYTQSNEHNSQISMVLRLESSCVNLTVIVNDIVLVVATC